MPFDPPYVPEYCVWELTLRCNMRCIHCGSSAGRARDNELTLPECFVVADALAKLGCKYVTLIGGEYFLYSGWEKVASRLASAGIAVNIITNGYVLGDEQISQIREARLSNVCLSVDGVGATHDRIRNNRSSFEHVTRTLERLNSEQIPTSAVTTLMAINIDELPQLYDYLSSHGVQTWQIQLATPMGNLANNTELLLSPERVPEVTRFIREKRRADKLWIIAGDDIGYYGENEMYLRNFPGALCAWQGCSAGLRTVGIDSVGNVKGCESLYDPRFIEGNLREQSLAEIWNGKGNFAYNRRFDKSQLTGACAGCDKGERCRGGCRGMCYFNQKGMFENPYCCYPMRPRVTKVDADSVVGT